MSVPTGWLAGMNAVRDGKIWAMLRGEAPMPPAAHTLGWRALELDPEAGTVTVEFTASEQFLNPVGVVQGGFLAAMLDDTLGPALAIGLPSDQFAPTLDLYVQFLRPARPGPIIGHGRVVKRGRDICFLAGELTGPDGQLIATATATARITVITG
jgi:uncharacterized protein (TIGR00369 family)